MESESYIDKSKVERKRHIAKTFTWRIIGTIDTWVISWLLLTHIGDISLFNLELSVDIKKRAVEASSYIAALEPITKTIFYYFHERIWYSLNFISFHQRIRHIIKTISWRFVGAVDTILLVFTVFYFLFSSVKGASEVALSMFSIEIITKMILYYLHERIWFGYNWGVTKKTK